MFFIIILTSCFIMFLLPIITPKHHWIRYYACYLTYASFTIATIFVAGACKILFPSKYDGLVDLAVVVVSKIIGIQWEVKNGNLMKKHHKAVIVLNHQSIFDLMAGLIVCKPLSQYNAVIKKELKIFLVGRIVRSLGVLYIDRKNNTNKAMAMLKYSFTSQEKSLIIFPEGTRNQKGGPLLPFKKGAFRIAVENQVPIIPIVISPYFFIKPKKSFAGGNVLITVMEPIITTNLREEDIDDLTMRTRELMDQKFSALQKQLPICD